MRKGLDSFAMDRILSLIEHYGYLVILFGVMLESTGVPLPGETILLAAGVLVQRGHLDLGYTIAFGITGAVLGDQIGYWVGREGGRPFVLKWGRYVFITQQRLGHAEASFERHGGKAVFLARFFSGLRIFGALVAGISRMRWATFITYNALGGTVWATAVVLLGYFLGSSLALVERWLGRATLVFVLVLAVAVGFYLAYRWAARNGARLVGWGEALLAHPPVARLRRRYDRQLRWMLRRLTPGQYLGLHLTLGLIAAGGCLWLFGGVVEDLLTGDPLVRFDRVVDDYLHSHATPPLTKFFLVVTAFGSLEAIVLLGVVVAALLAWRRMWTLLVTWLAAVAGSALLDRLLKEFFHRPRRRCAHPFLVEACCSLPGGRAMGGFGGEGVVGGFAGGAGRAGEARVGVVCGAALLVVLIGFSRMYLGVHYFSDVVAGYAAGGVWLSALITGAETIRRSKTHGNKPRTRTS